MTCSAKNFLSGRAICVPKKGERMILKFATKRNRNGVRRFLGIDTEKRVYAKSSSHWLCREDFVEISGRDMDRIRADAEDNGYTETENI